MENEIDKLNQEVEKLEARLIAQDNRLVHSLITHYPSIGSYSKNFVYMIRRKIKGVL